MRYTSEGVCPGRLIKLYASFNLRESNHRPGEIPYNEVENNSYDLMGTVVSIPDINLVPDLIWLIRVGVDPIWFIDTYQKHIVYLHIRDQWKTASGQKR